MAEATHAATLDDQLATYIQVCTTNRDHFLTSPMPILVQSGDVIVDDELVERVACRDSKEPGNAESNHIRLDDDGHIVADFGNGTDVWASCYSLSYSYPCSADDF